MMALFSRLTLLPSDANFTDEERFGRDWDSRLRPAARSSPPLIVGASLIFGVGTLMTVLQ